MSLKPYEVTVQWGGESTSMTEQYIVFAESAEEAEIKGGTPENLMFRKNEKVVSVREVK